MSTQENQLTTPVQTLCSKCKRFYGSEAFKGMCSGCYKKIDRHAEDEACSKLPQIQSPTSTSTEIAEKLEELTLEPKETDRKRCYICRKKLGLLGVECKCELMFCNMHRLPEDHDCAFDHRKIANQKLKKQIVKVYNGKVTKI